jgi:sulfite exporter TauE/SafE
MNNEITLLIVTAATLGFIHTLTGPDHYIPFIALAESEKWSKSKTALITLLCGLGHVLSSIVIGLTGIALGIALFSIEAIESFRGEIAGWLLIGFGIAYTIWGIRRSYKKKKHSHFHYHPDGTFHSHTHSHEHPDHAHLHEKEKSKTTPWIVFLIFVFGPCEPLIPLLMYPAAKQTIFGTFIVAAVFSVITISTMLALVFLGLYGINFLPIKKLELHIHTLAGLTILLCGISIKFLGL